MINWLDEEGFILSHILSYLKLDHIYATSRVSRQWHQTLSKAYFLSDTFNLDDILCDESFPSYAQELKNNFLALIPRPYEDGEITLRNLLLVSEKWKGNHLMQLLKCMRCNHTSVEKVKIIESYDWMRYFGQEYEEVVSELAALFPCVSEVRVGFLFTPYKTRTRIRRWMTISLHDFLETLSRQFVGLNQVFMIADTTRRLSYSLKEPFDFEKFKIKHPTLKFVKVTSDMLEIECLERMKLGSEEQLVDILKTYPWLLKVRIGGNNFLQVAVLRKYKECVRYILERNPSLIFQSYLHESMFSSHPLLSAVDDDEMIEMMVEKIQSISHKSDQFLEETLPQFNARNTTIFPIPMLFYQTSEKYSGFHDKLKVDTRLLSFQTRYMTNCEDRYLKTDLEAHFPNNYKHEYEIHSIMNNDELNKKVFILDGCGQSVLHHLFFPNTRFYESHRSFELHNFLLLKERVPSVTKLLLQPNNRGEVPLQLFVAGIRPYFLMEGRGQEFTPSARIMIEEMLKENTELAKEVFGKICVNLKHLSLFYNISKLYFTPKLYIKKQEEFCHWYVCYTGDRKTFNLLFSSGTIDAKAVDENGQTLLHKMAKKSNTYGCFFLYCMLYNGNGIDQQDRDGNTPLHLASNYQVARTLRKYGADPNLVNKKGEKAFERYMAPGCKYKKIHVEKLVMCEHCLKVFKSHKSLERHLVNKIHI